MAFSPRTAAKDASEDETYDITNVLHEEYGIEVSKLICMAGLCDRTYRVNDSYVFKVFVDPYTQDERQIDAEISLITFLKDRLFPVPEIIPTRRGAFHCVAEIYDKAVGRKAIRPVRLQMFLKGNLLCNKPINPDICIKAGELTGQMDKALEHYHHPFYAGGEPLFIIRCSETWDARVLVRLLTNERQSRLACQALELFEQIVIPFLDVLPKQQIHNDAHTRNLIVDEECTRILGIIDFTDSRYTCRVYEVAIALPSILSNGVNPYPCVRAFMTGYRKHVDLNALEQSVLMACVCARLVMVMTINQWFKCNFPQNYDEAYICSMFGRSWDVLDDLLNNPDKQGEFFLSTK